MPLLLVTLIMEEDYIVVKTWAQGYVVYKMPSPEGEYILYAIIARVFYTLLNHCM